MTWPRGELRANTTSVPTAEGRRAYSVPTPQALLQAGSTATTAKTPPHDASSTQHSPSTTASVQYPTTSNKHKPCLFGDN